MITIIAILVVGAFVWRVLTPEDRALLFARVVSSSRKIAAYGLEDLEPFWTALRARTPRVFVTPLLAAVHIVVFLGAAFTAGPLSDPATLVEWGASSGPATTNGEWWRLMTAGFVHSGFIALVIDVAALLQIGVLLERLVGAFAFWTAYLSAAMLASQIQLWADPIVVSTSASAGVFGILGLLIASAAGGWLLHRPDTLIPPVALLRLTPVTCLFLLFNLFNANPGSGPESLALATGLVIGCVSVRGLHAGKPASRPVAVALASAFVLVVAGAVPLRGIQDVRPEIQRLVELEQRTAGAYETALGAFKKKSPNVEQLAELIEGAIMPELRQAAEHVQSLRGVPTQDQWLVDDAREFLRLRAESWRLRAEGLRQSAAPVRATKTAPATNVRFAVQAAERHRTTTMTLGKAEATARAALQLLDRIRA